MATSNPALDDLGDYPLAPIQDLAEELRADPEPVHDFSIGDPDEPTPLFIRQALVDAIGPVSRYPTSAGRPELRAAVARWLRRRHGVEVDPDQHIIPTSGSKEAIFHLPFAVIDPGAEKRGVIWGQPGYPVYERGTRFSGGRGVPIALRPENGWLLELHDVGPLRLDKAAVAWVNYPHNPTGATADVGYYRRQLAVARQNGILLCSDECYQEVWFEDAPPSALEASGGDLTGILTFVSLSKRSGMTGYRSGAVIGDPELIDRLRVLRPSLGTAPPDFVQEAAIAAWSDQMHVHERRAIFADKRRIVLEFLHRAGLEVSGSAATFYVWFRAPGGDDYGYVEALLHERVIASPGRAFGPAGAGWVRLALVPTATECEAATQRWGAAIEAGRLPS
jgi:succinyldiaminopimelate transaminase